MRLANVEEKGVRVVAVRGEELLVPLSDAAQISDWGFSLEMATSETIWPSPSWHNVEVVV